MRIFRNYMGIKIEYIFYGVFFNTNLCYPIGFPISLGSSFSIAVSCNNGNQHLAPSRRQDMYLQRHYKQGLDGLLKSSTPLAKSFSLPLS